MERLQDKIVLGELHTVTGFQASGVSAKLRRHGRPDFSIVYSEQDCTAAGVFTTNQVKAAPVLLDIEHLQADPSCVRAVVTNAAIANACTGEQGMQNARQTAEMAAEKLGLEPTQVLVLSTGVIGVQLPMEKIADGIEIASDALASGQWEEAAKAIMTTDTRPKAYSIQSTAGYSITGIAKGSGMIAPNMATMLSIISTDAKISAELLQDALRQANALSFNSISVDGDTSTNDTVLLLANGASGVEINRDNQAAFVDELTEVCQALARMIVLDGEGATKYISIQVVGACSVADAHQIANTIATSSLVKTAFYGADANWGRILAAAGRAGVPIDPDKLNLWFRAVQVADDLLQVVAAGTPTDYAEADASHIFAQDEIDVVLDLGLGDAAATVWTCDLSHEYVSINADYRT